MAEDCEALERATRDWARLGRMVEVRSADGGRSVWAARIASEADSANPPLLIVHGFPTCSYDWHGVMALLAAERDVVVFDMHGFGLSDKPDHRYSVRAYADDLDAVAASFDLEEVDLLTHDLGDTVGGELLARQLDGTTARPRVRRRVLSNGSIYIDQAQLTVGQQLLLGLPDAIEPAVGADGGASFRTGVAATFAPGTELTAAAEDDLDVVVGLAARGGGLGLLPRTIRYIEDRRQEERRFTGAIEAHPSPVGIVWGTEDPVAVPAMVDRFLEARPSTPVVLLEGVGHYPMVEAPVAFASAVLGLLDGDLADSELEQT